MHAPGRHLAAARAAQAAAHAFQAGSRRFQRRQPPQAGPSPDVGLLHLVEPGPRKGGHHQEEALHAGRQRAQVDAQRVLPRVALNQVAAVLHAPCSGRRWEEAGRTAPVSMLLALVAALEVHAAAAGGQVI